MAETDRTWVVVHEIRKEDYVARVSRKGRRQYNVEILREYKLQETGEVRTSKFFPVWIDGRGKLEIRRPSTLVLGLMVEAEDWILAQAQLDEDSFIESRIQNETAFANRDQRQPPRGLSGGQNSGKTQRRREAKRNRRQFENSDV
jgi:hypothetical protein